MKGILMIFRKVFLAILFIASAFIFVAPAMSQFKNVAVGIGIQTTSILIDNPANWPILERDTGVKHDVGGGFKGSQLGYSIRADIPVDTGNRFTIPVGFDYTIFEAKQRVPIMPQTTLFMRHTINVPTIILGLNYKLFKFPIANVWGFVGIETRSSFILPENFYVEMEYRAYDSVYVNNSKAKSNAFRFGGDFKFGFEGEISKPWFVNVNAGFGAMNLFGRDDARGELLTPIGPPLTQETSESVVWNFHFGLLLQYRF